MANKDQPPNQTAVWDNQAQSYDEMGYWKSQENRANLAVLLSHIGNPKGKRFIEVGSGSGFTSAVLAERGAECALLDLSQEALDVGMRNFMRRGLPEPQCYNENALQSSVPSNYYDAVWNMGVLEHFYDDGKKKLVREMYRMTKPEGSVIVMVPNAWCWPFQIAQKWKKIRKSWAYGFEDDLSPRRLAKICNYLKLDNYVSYAYNPIHAWSWFPFLNKVIARWDTLDHHLRQTWMGYTSILVVKKDALKNRP
jgi:ubiquinone/menaquinone biosynthesis C-methylase UbiE